MLVALSLVAPAALAAGGSPVPVKSLVNSADAIVIVPILDGIVGTDAVMLHLDVEETLKGTVQPREVLSVNCTLNPEAARNTKIEKDRGIFFLQKSRGTWSILPVHSGYLHDLRRAFFILPTERTPNPIALGPGASIHERIVAEVAGALEQGNLPEGGAVDFMFEFRANPSSAMKDLFSQFRKSKRLGLRVAALRASVHDPEGLRALAAGEFSGLGEVELSSLTDEVYTRLAPTDPDDIERLGRIATSESAPYQLRNASLRALVRSHSADTLQYLAPFLDDPNAELRSLAVGGLSKFANNVPIGEFHGQAPGPCKYCSANTIRYSGMDAKYIQDNPGNVVFWKSWWAERRAELPRAKSR
jgi:hypothetical protein